MNMPASVEHVTDIKEIAKYGIVKTPALMVNDQFVVSGTVPSVKKIKELIGGAQAGPASLRNHG